MRIPKVNKYMIDQKITKEILKINKSPYIHMDDYDNFDDKKELAKFVKRLKSMIRKSYEYRRLMEFLKRHAGLNMCGIHTNIKRDEGFSINIHHSPFTMEDIIYTVINKRYNSNESLKMCLIAEEIMMLHYLCLIGLYPLCETCHEYAHNDDNDLFIPFDVMYGDVEKFFDIYKEMMTEELQNKFKNLIELNKGYRLIENNIPNNLMRKYIYIEDNEGNEFLSIVKLHGFIEELMM